MVHDGTRVEVPTAREREVPRQLRKLVSGAREQCTRVVRVEPMVHERCTGLCSGARDCRVVHDGTRVEVPTARQREVPQQLRKLASGAREWYEWSTAMHERCMRLRSGARDCGVVHEYEWCTRVRSGARVVHEIGGARVEVHEIGGARVVHEYTVHLDSTF